MVLHLNKGSSKGKFPCNQCGWCCQNLQKHELYKDLDRGDGVCIYFNKIDNNCAVYSNRPLICNIDAMYHSMFSNIDYGDYINLNIKAYQAAQIENKLPIIQI